MPGPGRAPDGRSLDLPGALLATAGITLGSFGLVLTDAHAWGSAPVLVPLLSGMLLLAAFGAVERRTADPLLPPDFLRDGRRSLGLAAIGLTAALHGHRLRPALPLLPAAARLGRTAHLRRLRALRGRPARLGTAGGPADRAVRPRTRDRDRARNGGRRTRAARRDRFRHHGAVRVRAAPRSAPAATAGALSFSAAAVLATDDVPAHRAGLAGGVLNTAMELGPTVLFAALLTLGGDAVSLAAAAALFAALAVLTIRVK